MNIFNSRDAFLGNYSVNFMRKNSNEFWTLTREIRSKLGVKKYLLDSYLSMFFEIANCQLAQESASRGFYKFSEFYDICCKIHDKKPFDEENEFYNNAKKFIDENPLPYQEKATKVNIYCLKLLKDFTDYITKKFVTRADNLLREKFDFIEFKGYYSEICNIVCEEKMEYLNLLLKNYFIISPFLKIFLQAIQNQVLYCLSYRD